jgi:DNA repair protein RadC
MPEKKKTLLVRANVEMTAASLQAIVENAKRISGPNEKGGYRVDTADKVSEMISRFLLENDFENFVMNVDNYG